MAKNNRGKTLRTVPGRARGKCPICGRTAIKLLYEVKKGDETIKVCKYCRKRKIEVTETEEA